MMTPPGSLRITTTIAASTLMLTGCATDRGYVQREWSTTMRELGIVPVFPPREDVFVGDVYAYDFNPDDPRIERILQKKVSSLDSHDRSIRSRIGMSPRTHRINLTAAAESEYADTLAAPATPSDYNSILGNQALAAAAAKVAEAEKQLAKAQEPVATARTAVTSAATVLRDAERKKEDADRVAADAQTALDALLEQSPDLSTHQSAVENARRAVEDQTVVVSRAKAGTQAAQAALDAIPDGGDKTAALNALADAKAHEAEQAARLEERQIELARRQRELNDASKDRPDVVQAKANLATAHAAQRAARDALTMAQRAKADADRVLAERTETSKSAIEKASAGVAAAKATQTAIAAAGQKLLYSQPRDASRTVYTASALPGGGADDLRNARVNRLRLVGFPEFATASFSQGDLSALIPIEAFTLGLNASSARARRVSVKVPSAESYGVSIGSLIASPVDPQLIQDLKDEITDLKEEILNKQSDVQEAELSLELAERRVSESPKGNQNELKRRREARDTARMDLELDRIDLDTSASQLPQLLTDLARLEAHDHGLVVECDGTKDFRLHPDIVKALSLQFKGGTAYTSIPGAATQRDQKIVYLRVPTEVFYARALDVSVFYANSYGVKAKLDLIVQNEMVANAANAQPAETATSAAPSQRVASPTGADLLKGVEGALSKVQAVPGGSVQVVGFNETSIGLRRVFDRPVAIGFRALTFTVDLADDGRVVRVEPSNTSTPASRFAARDNPS